MLNSCATILTGDSQKIFVDTEPQGAKVYINGEDQRVLTPATLDVKRIKQAVYTFQKQGYKDGTVVQDGSFNFVSLGNIILGGIIGIGVDFATGASWQYKNSNVFYQFNSADFATGSTIRESETESILLPSKSENKTMEQIAIRWNLDSKPSDSGIFLRVISNIPDQVGSTIEKLLSSTPYKEVSQLNIAGLTYDNSKDVDIEIKIIKSGYYTQIKRYNLRQVIDKQEISDLFEMESR